MRPTLARLSIWLSAHVMHAWHAGAAIQSHSRVPRSAHTFPLFGLIVLNDSSRSIISSSSYRLC